jgi:SEC-C motif
MKISRNDLFPCGSGRKYKNCCLEDQGSGLPHEGPAGVGSGGAVFHFLARHATDIFSVARCLRRYYRNMIIAKIASGGIFIPGFGE